MRLRLKYFELLLTADWILDRCRAMTKVPQDVSVSNILDGMQEPTAASSPSPKAAFAAIEVE